MQGSSLLKILLFISLTSSLAPLAKAQDELDADLENFKSDSASEPEPSSVLAPKADTGNDVSEFEEMGGEDPKKKQAKPAPAPAAPATTPEDPLAPPPEPKATATENVVAPTPTPEPAPTQKAENLIPEPTPAPTESGPTAESLSKAKKEEPAPKPARRQSTPRPQVAKVETGEVPDYGTEERFHRIYKAYNELPTSEEAWEKARNEKIGQIYDVQQGDTLWDVSNTLFGDANFWPKIWSLNNDQVLNPHLITPDLKIRFFPGDLQDLPSVAVSAPAPAITTEPKLAKNDEPNVHTDAPVMPPPHRKSKKLAKIPESLPIYRMGRVNKPPPKVEIDIKNIPWVTPPMHLSHYVFEGDLPVIGTVKETELGMATASEFQYVIVELEEENHKTAHVVIEQEDVKNPFTTFGAKGKLVEVQAEIQILDRVSDDENLYRAIVKKSLAPLQVGGLILAGAMPKADIKPSKATSAAEAMLVGGQYSSGRVLYPKDSIVFFDAGSSAGLNAGQSLSVYANLKTRNNKTNVKIKNKLVGTVKILKTTDNFSTAYVTEAFEELQIGDLVGGSATIVPTQSSGDMFDDNKDEPAATSSSSGSSDSQDGSSESEDDLAL